MARIRTPINSTQCGCGVVLRDEEMVRNEYQGVDYLLCPKCKIALFMIRTDVEDETQLPKTIKEPMDRGDVILFNIRRRQREDGMEIERRLHEKLHG